MKSLWWFCFCLVSLFRFVAQYGGSCGVAVETAGRRMALQVEGRLRETLERLKLTDQASAAGNSVGNSNNLEVMLHQLLSAARTQASRLTKLESNCFSSPGAGMGMNTKTRFQLPESGGAGHQEQEVTSRDVVLDTLLAALQQTKTELGEVLRSSRQRYLPAGETSIFPSVICVCLYLLLSVSLYFSSPFSNTATQATFHLQFFFLHWHIQVTLDVKEWDPPLLGL